MYGNLLSSTAAEISKREKADFKTFVMITTLSTQHAKLTERCQGVEGVVILAVRDVRCQRAHDG